MNKALEKFVLADGYISMNNKQLFIDINNTKKDLKQRGGWLGVFLGFVGISVLNNIRDIEYFKKAFHYFDFGLRVLGMIAIICIVYYLFFLKKSKKNLIINEITQIEVEELEFETEISLKFISRRHFDISFRNLENQVEPFIEEIKKRNTRIKVINL